MRDRSWWLRIAGVASLTVAILGLGWVYIGQDHSITHLERRKPASGPKGDQGPPGASGAVVVQLPTANTAPAGSGGPTTTTRPPAATTTTTGRAGSTTSTTTTTTTSPPPTCTTKPTLLGGGCL